MLAGCGCALAALCYAEFAAMIPVSGSAYSYAYVAFGEIIAWFIGWNLVLEYTFSVATVSVGWSGYVMSLLAQAGIHLPAALTLAPFDRGPGSFSIVATGALVNVPAVLSVAVVTVVCYVGIRESSTINSIIVAVKIAVVALFALVGSRYVDPANWHPFIPPNTGHFGEFGWSGIFAASGVIVFAYIGFDAISTCAQEARNPGRDLPISILTGNNPPMTAAANPVTQVPFAGVLYFGCTRANQSGRSPSMPMVMKMRAWPTVMTNMTEVIPAIAPSFTRPPSPPRECRSNASATGAATFRSV